MSFIVKLPWPPSVNHYYEFINIRGKGGKSHISKKLSARGAAFKADVFEICRTGGELKERFGDVRLALTVQVYPPDRRKRDLDNLGKAIQDSLSEAGIYDDDSQIDELHFSRKEVIKGGFVMVAVEALS